MNAISYERGLPACFGFAPAGFSFYEPSQIEIPAPIQYQMAQEWRQFQLRDKGPDWYLWNALHAHEAYMRKRSWWVTFV